MKRHTRARARLVSQRLVGQTWDSAAETVEAFGLMQGQETTVFSSIALRSLGGMQSVCDALDAHEIVRGYPMRGTVFAGMASEMRWMTELLAKPGPERAAVNCVKAGLNAAHIDTIRDLVVTEGPVTNSQFKDIVARATGLKVPEPAMVYRSRYLLLVDGTCAYVGRDQLLAPAPVASGIEQRFNGERQEAVNSIVRRYVATHGPVTFDDISWWSKLPVGEIRTALDHLGEGFVEVCGDFMSSTLLGTLEALPASVFRTPHLLPAFDEYILGYKDRLFAMTQDVHAHLAPRNMGVFRKSIVVDGQVRATWKKAAGRLDVADIAGIPKYAQPGIRRKFSDFPSFPASYSTPESIGDIICP